MSDLVIVIGVVLVVAVAAGVIWYNVKNKNKKKDNTDDIYPIF